MNCLQAVLASITCALLIDISIALVCNGHGHWDHRCVCDHGYAGTHCEVQCLNGGVQSNHDPSRCHCSDKWAGRACDINCHHGHYDDHDRTKCHCDPGWTGTYCDQNVITTTKITTTSTTTRKPTTPAECSGHGHFDSHVRQCVCEHGWDGQHCEHINCGNHGKLSGSTCVCIQGYAGTHCEIHCLNGGIQNNHDHSRCNCSTKYAGAACEIDCHHGHHAESDRTKCQCDPGWAGTNCDQNDCGSNGHWDGHKCACNWHFAGANCEKHCQNNGTQSTRDPTSCHCPTRWAGLLCDIDCNHGIYNQSDHTKCQCDSGWTGDHCEYIVTTTTTRAMTTTSKTTTTSTTTPMPTTPAVPMCSKVNGTGPFTHSNATACHTAEKGSHEALVLYHCSTVSTNTSSWQPGQQVTSKNCVDMRSKNAAVATFVNSQYIRDGGLSGLVVGCLPDGFQLTVQGCGFGVITLNITTGGMNLLDPFNYYTIQ